jgi:hypothetical protein
MDVNDQRARGTSSRASVSAIENVMGAEYSTRFFGLRSKKDQRCRPSSSGSSVEVAMTLTGLPLTLFQA